MLRKVVLLIAAIGMAAFFTKLGWDEYQQNRATEQVPHVKAIFHKIRQMPGAEAAGDFSISVNEYAAALWQEYKVQIKCSELRPHFDSEISRLSFEISNEYETYGGPMVEYKNGEFEIRVLCRPDADGYSFSVNWYGLDR